MGDKQTKSLKPLNNLHSDHSQERSSCRHYFCPPFLHAYVSLAIPKYFLEKRKLPVVQLKRLGVQLSVRYLPDFTLSLNFLRCWRATALQLRVNELGSKYWMLAFANRWHCQTNSNIRSDAFDAGTATKNSILVNHQKHYVL